MLPKLEVRILSRQSFQKKVVEVELPQLCMFGYEWKYTCSYNHASHTQLWQLLSNFLELLCAQDV